MEMELLSLETIKTVFSQIQFNKDDGVVVRSNFNLEVDRQGGLTIEYGYIWAQAGKMKLKAERQVKMVRAQVELEYRSGERGNPNEKKTEASIKALVETDADVVMAEKILIEATYWYNIATNYDKAISQRMDLIRIISKDMNKDTTQYSN